MRTARSSVVACLVAVAAVLLPAGSADAAGGSEVPQVPSLELYGIEHTAVARAAVPEGHRPLARSQSESMRLRLPVNFARLLVAGMPSGRGAARLRRELRDEVRSEGLGEYVHVGPLHGRRFTVTAISDQVCATVRPHHRGSIGSGPCVAADRRASMKPLQDSANLLLDLARESFEYGRRNDALRELYAPFVLGWVSRLIAPQGVEVSGVADGDHDGLDDDGRVAFHANGTSVCASLPVSASGSGAITFSSCRRLPARHVQIHENARAVFREMKRGADYGASFRARTTHQRARRAARMAPALSSHSEARAQPRGDRVQFRAKVNGRVRYACYRVSPDGHRATYSSSGRPGTWRLGRCR